MNNSDYEKQVIVLRKDLDMGKGKLISQGAHASMAALLKSGEFTAMGIDEFIYTIIMDPDMAGWVKGSFTKIAVWCGSEEELLSLHQQAVDAGLNNAIIRDNGKTAFHGVPTLTAIAIGPNLASKIDPITRHLKLIN